MKRKIIIFGMLTLMVSLGAQAYTNVDGFYGETWLDHVDEDGFENFGSGTESAPWQIRSAGALAYLARAVNNGETYEGKYFVIAANIDLGYKPSGSKLVWVPIGCTNSPTSSGASVFKGTLTNGTDADGNPFTISGMTIRAYGTGTTSCFGLFGALRGTVDGYSRTRIFLLTKPLKNIMLEPCAAMWECLLPLPSAPAWERSGTALQSRPPSKPRAATPVLPLVDL